MEEVLGARRKASNSGVSQTYSEPREFPRAFLLAVREGTSLGLRVLQIVT